MNTHVQAKTAGFIFEPAVYVSILMLVAFFASFFVWMPQSLRLDEAQSIWQTSRDLGGVMNIIAKDVHVPLYFVGLHFWETAFGTSEFALRFFSLMFLVASIPLVFKLAREAYSLRVAYLASLVTVVSPFLNWYGSEARMYSLLFLFTVLSHLFFLRLMRREGGVTWVSYAVVTILGAFTHFFFGFIILSQVVFFFWRKELFGERAVRYFVRVMLVTAIFGSLWVAYRFLAGTGLTNPLLTRPTSVDFFNVFSNFFIGFQTDRINTFYLSLWPLLVFVGFTFLAKKRRHDPQTAYLTIASFMPVILAFIVSATVLPIFLSRYLIVALPSLYILAVYFISLYKGGVSDAVFAVLAATMVLMLMIQAIEPLSPVKEDYRGAARYVAEKAKSDDLFVVSAPFITYPVEYYYNGEARLSTFPRWDRFAKDAVPEAYSDAALSSTADGWASVYENVYLLLGYDQGYEEKVRLYMDKHYERVDLRKFSPGLSLYVYRLRYL